MSTMSTNLKAFLSTIAYSELGEKLLLNSDRGYNVLVGGALFSSYADHPRKLVFLPNLFNFQTGKRGLFSSAAGRYQIMRKNFDAYKTRLKLIDFSPASQDALAIQLIRECGALQDIEEGRFTSALFKCRSRWASFPGSPYGQHTNKIVDLHEYYAEQGGTTSKED